MERKSVVKEEEWKWRIERWKENGKKNIQMQEWQVGDMQELLYDLKEGNL